MAKVTLNFKVPEELHKKIIKEAEKLNISMASLIRMILSEYLNKRK